MYSKSKWIFIIGGIVFLINHNTFAIQKQEADSLYDLAWEYMDYNADSALIFAKQYKAIAFNLEDYNEKVYSCYTVGYAYYKLNYLDQAAYNYFEGLALLKEPKEKTLKKLKVDYLQCISIVYDLTYNYDLALEYATKALESVRSTIKDGSDNRVAELIYNIGIINSKKRDYERARDNYDKAIAIASKIGDKSRLSKIYNALGDLYFELNKFDSARNYFVKANKISDELKGLEGQQAMYMGNIGECYYHQNDFEKAREYYLKALPVSKQFNDTRRIKWLYYNLGNLSKAEGNHEEAIDFYHQCIALGDENIIDEYYKKASRQLSSTYQQIGDLSSALSYINKYNNQLEKIEETKENLTQQNAQYRMKEVEWKLEKKAKEAKIAKIETENIWVKILVTIALIVIFVGSRYTFIYHKKIARIKEVVYMDDVDPDEYA